jgi:hypothetical protein
MKRGIFVLAELIVKICHILMSSQIQNDDQRRLAKVRRIAALLAGFMRNTLSPDEQDELDEWVGADEKNMRLFEELTDEKRIKKGLTWMNENIPYALKLSERELKFRFS